VLVLLNLGSEPVTDYKLRLSSGPLSGKYSVTPLLGFGDFDTPQIDSQGGFENYIPIPEIPAYGRIVLQLMKELK